MGKGANTNMMNTANTQPMPSGGKGGAVAPRGIFSGALSTSPRPIPTNPDGTPAGVQPIPTSGPFMPYTGEPAPMNPPQPSAGKGGGLQARNDFMNADNELNRIKAEQMALERKARQEALNRSYYNQPAPQPTGASNLSDQEVLDYYASRGEMVAMPADIKFAQERMDDLRARMPADLSQPPAPVQPNLRTMPASRNPFNRRTMGQMDRLNAAYRNRLERFNNPMDNIPDRLGMETPQLDAEYENFLRRRMNPNQVMNRFTGVRRAAFGEPLQISSAFGSPFSGLTAMGRERFNPALVNAPVGVGPRVNSGRGGKGDFGAYVPYVNI